VNPAALQALGPLWVWYVVRADRAQSAGARRSWGRGERHVVALAWEWGARRRCGSALRAGSWRFWSRAGWIRLSTF